ncbi:MAG: hypothetical protein HY360_14975 [Verrucomicrobia bacterium]|nr:hypothetical protein [Verrucomicrobiota bacterium]
MKPFTLHTALEQAAFPRQALERFLDPNFPSWAKHDPELGYRLSNVAVKDGVDDARSIYTYEPNGARRMIHYRGRPCRINTYGDSFTQCHQVSDGETWQEALAAHFGEPVRNFGVGGYGVYQAYRRMKRVEATPDGAPCVILNIYDDDHHRNLMACRWVHTRWFYPAARDGVMFHNTPWVHVRIDPATGQWGEHENPFRTAESLFRLCDPAFMYETYRDDPVVKLEVLRYGGTVEDAPYLRALADCFDVKLDFSTPESSRRTGCELYLRYALQSTRFVVEQARQFCAARGKKLMILLSYGSPNVVAALRGQPRFDQPLVDWLKTTGLPVVDALDAHVEDFKAFRLGPEEYIKRYYIGHYNPTGNHFFAFAIKGALLDWLDPKPFAYASGEVSLAGFAAKLA